MLGRPGQRPGPARLYMIAACLCLRERSSAGFACTLQSSVPASLASASGTIVPWFPSLAVIKPWLRLISAWRTSISDGHGTRPRVWDTVVWRADSVTSLPWAGCRKRYFFRSPCQAVCHRAGWMASSTACSSWLATSKWNWPEATLPNLPVEFWPISSCWARCRRARLCCVRERVRVNEST